jgi:hypothetical protein
MIGRARTLAVIGGVAILGIAAARQVSIGAREFAAADAAVSRGAWPDAVAHARAAAEASAPSSPWPDRAFRRLDSIAQGARARGDVPTARLAYAAMSAAAVAARSPWSGHAAWIDRASDALSRLETDAAGPAVPAVPAQAAGFRSP